MACIGTGKTVTVSEGTRQSGVVEGDGTLLLTGGSLEVTNALEVSRLGSLTVQNATLTGAGTVDVSGSFISAQGTMAGSGSTVILPGATGTFQAGNQLITRSFVNEGTTTLVVAVAGRITASEGAHITNAGTFNANVEIGKGTGTASIVNTGTFQKSEGTEPAKVTVSLENLGTVRSQSHELLLIGGGSGTGGTWAASEGASLVLEAGALSLNGGSISGAVVFGFGSAVTEKGVNAENALLTVNSGSLSVQSGIMTAKTLELFNATVSGAGSLAISSFLRVSQSTLSGAGSTVVLPGASATIAAENLLVGRSLVNEGTTTLSRPIAGKITESEGAQIRNAGTFNANTETAAIKAGTGASSIRNTGTFEKAEGTETTEIEPNFENLGTVQSIAGKLKILHPIGAEPSTQYGGAERPSTPNQPHPMCGHKPVSCATGNESETQTDLAIGGRGVGLTLERTYNSQAAAAGAKGALGYGWTSSFSDHLVVEPSAKLATLVQANGSTVPFTEGSGGAYTAPAWTQNTLSGTSETGYTMTLANQIKYHFAGASGRLESVTDRNGNATSLSYGESGRLEAITDPASRKLTLAYNGEGLIESATDPMGHVAKYAYEGGNLIAVTEPGEVEPRWRFKYDGSHQLTEMTDGRGGKTVNEYNGAHQVVSQTDPLKHVLTFEYEPFETKITNHATGSVTDEHFTSTDLPVSITHGLGTGSATTASFSYDASSNVLATTDGNNHATKYTYDASSNRTSMLDPNKNETKWTYNATHDVETTTTPKGETTTIKRDVNGNAETISRPAPGSTTQTTNYKYGAHGELTSVEDPLKRTWKYEYNTSGDRTAEIDPEADKRTWGYNEDSQETSTVSPRGVAAGGTKEAKYKTTIERDPQGRPTLVIAPLKHETKYTYDGNGDLATLTDPELNVTKYTYDADNEPIKVEEPDAAITETGYDGAGQVTSQTDGNKHTTIYVRNPVEEVTEVIDPLSRNATKGYDAAGNLTSLTDAVKRTTTYKYDPANRLVEVSYSDGTTPTVQYEYDADGNRTKMIDGTGTSKYTYDQLDRLTESKDGHGNVSSYEYDLANQQTKLTYPNGKAVTRSFDNAARLKSVTDWLAHTTKFGYDADSNLTATAFPSTTGNEDGYAYNEADAMSEAKMAKGAETLASLVYVRNKDGRVTKATTTGLPGEAIPAFAYDSNSRLTKGAGIVYKYDAAENPTKIATPTYTYDNASELKTGTGLGYTYDEMGERTKTKPTSGPATSYGYDQAGNLASVSRPAEGEIPAIADSYGYNGDGLRASQTVGATTSYLAWDPTTSTPLVLNDGQNSYVYGADDQPVEQVDGEGNILYMHHDQQGSTRMLTSPTGAVSATTTYDAYGNRIGTTGTGTTSLGYDGQLTSPDTGLIYLRARVYDPATTQLLTRDPLAAVTRAPYNYAGDSPLAYGDATGLIFDIPGTPSVSDVGQFFTDHWRPVASAALNVATIAGCTIPLTAGGCGGYIAANALAQSALVATGPGSVEKKGALIAANLLLAGGASLAAGQSGAIENLVELNAAYAPPIWVRPFLAGTTALPSLGLTAAELRNALSCE